MWDQECLLCGFKLNRQEEWVAHMAGHSAEQMRCEQIAEAIDSGRGNEKEIARAIRLHIPSQTLPR